MSPENDPSKGEIVLYATKDGQTHVECQLRDETIWLTQQQIADLFGVDKSGVSRHLKNIYDEGELAYDSAVAKIATVQQEGARSVKRKVEHHNLDAIIAVGYRVNSYQATQFRIWATNTLKEFIVKGFVLDDERLKQAKQLFGKDYFEELLERIREIRASERRFYQKITEKTSSAGAQQYSPGQRPGMQKFSTNPPESSGGDAAATLRKTKGLTMTPGRCPGLYCYTPTGLGATPYCSGDRN